jgi:hypothetical protein
VEDRADGCLHLVIELAPKGAIDDLRAGLAGSPLLTQETESGGEILGEAEDALEFGLEWTGRDDESGIKFKGHGV